MTRPRFRAWITKYALTRGVGVAVVEDCGDGLVRIGAYYLGEGREWHRTRESAVKRVEDMRAAKIASLKRKIEKLKTPIEVPE
jgi:hypothetical protein